MLPVVRLLSAPLKERVLTRPRDLPFGSAGIRLVWHKSPVALPMCGMSEEGAHGDGAARAGLGPADHAMTARCGDGAWPRSSASSLRSPPAWVCPCRGARRSHRPERSAAACRARAGAGVGDRPPESEGINRAVELIARSAYGFRNPRTNAYALAASPTESRCPTEFEDPI